MINDTVVPSLATSETSARIALRADTLFHERYDLVASRTDELFRWLFVIQWLAGSISALLLSPQSWQGNQSHIHIHVWAAIFLGGAIAALPVLLIYTHRGRFSTRCVIAAAQMLTSALLIDITGGRIETHFHIFGSLAFLAFYRDWRVFIPAGAVVVADHLIRGIYWPASVYGVLASSPWRTVEHGGWILFETFFLVRSCAQSLREMRGLAAQQAQLESTNEIIEGQVRVRTIELRIAQSELIQASRQAGMAEIATGVLHNVGNALNSVNVSASIIESAVRLSNIAGVSRAATLLAERHADVNNFLANDQRGQQLPVYLSALATTLDQERQSLISEVESLCKNVHHINTIIAAQQSHAKRLSITEPVVIADVIRDALKISAAAHRLDGISVSCEFAPMPIITLDRHKLTQTLINLITNAIRATLDNHGEDRRLILRALTTSDGHLRIAIIDTGVGIAAENLMRIFSHGFTTKPDGHGFGLHSSALFVNEMGGELRADSPGAGSGATFTIDLPCVAPTPSATQPQIGSRRGALPADSVQLEETFYGN